MSIKFLNIGRFASINLFSVEALLAFIGKAGPLITFVLDTCGEK